MTAWVDHLAVLAQQITPVPVLKKERSIGDSVPRDCLKCFFSTFPSCIICVVGILSCLERMLHFSYVQRVFKDSKIFSSASYGLQLPSYFFQNFGHLLTLVQDGGSGSCYGFCFLWLILLDTSFQWECLYRYFVCHWKNYITWQYNIPIPVGESLY